MTLENWLAILAVVTPLALAGVAAVISLAMTQKVHGRQLDEHAERLKSHDDRITHQAGQISDIKPILATLVEGVEWIKQALDRRGTKL